MKSNKGITIISLLVYIIVLTVVIGTISTLMRYFYENEQESTVSEDSSNQYSRLIAYITDDINSGKVSEVNRISASDIMLIYNDNTVHEYQVNNNKMYNIIKPNASSPTITKKIELCDNVVANPGFSYNTDSKILTMGIKLNGRTYVNTFTVK